MLTLFREGGFPMWFLLVFGGLSLVCGARFALRPEPMRLRLTIAMSLATLFTLLTCVAAALAMVGHQLPSYLLQHPTESLPDALLQGVAESLSPAILGFTVLTLVSLFVALGCYRESLDT